MTTFDNREKSFENKFAHDEKLEFAVEAKLSRLYGEWAAEQLGLTGDEVKTYASGVVDANLEEPGFQDVLRHVRKDFDKKGLDISDHVMETKLAECLEKAKTLAEQD